MEHFVNYIESTLSKNADSQQSEATPDKGVHQSYKNIANSSANVMFRVKIKGRHHLDENLPLHVTLKTFDDPSKAPLDEIGRKVKELNIQRPDPSKLRYEATTFTSPKTGRTYYMLKLHGADPSYEKFNEHFKGQGITHDKFMSHVTIDKELHDKIKEEGIKPEEVEFSPLMIEHGANNPTHLFPDAHSHKDILDSVTPKKLNAVPNVKPKLEIVSSNNAQPKEQPQQTKLAASEYLQDDMNKGFLKQVGTAAAVAGALTIASPTQEANPSMHSQVKHSYSSQKMLHTIAQVESSGGKFANHRALGGMHEGEKAYGKYGLTPVVIRETIKMHPELKKKHQKAVLLEGDDLHRYMQDNPGLEDSVAQRHLKRLEHHFGQDPAKIGYAWLQGITGTYQASKENKDIHGHWHVRKIKTYFAGGR
jgi:2'-5' RNA ligase